MYNEKIETISYNGYNIDIYPDSDPGMSPEDWTDQELFIISDHSDCYIGMNRDIDIHDQDQLEELKKEYFIYPLYAYIHSGVSLSINNEIYPFNDRWDSGQIGLAFCKKDINADPDPIKLLQGLITEWNYYLSGAVYGYQITDPNGDDLDSCYGFTGSDWEDSFLPDCRAMIDQDIKNKRIKKQSRLKGLIKNNVSINNR